MGTALSTHDDLVHVRGWSCEQISALMVNLRQKHSVYTLTKDDYTRFLGGRNREAISVFNDLDTDYDGKIDIFETFVVLTIWSGTSWAEKTGLLFKLFDMMNKGWLKVEEVLLMGSVLLQAIRKFVKVDARYNDDKLLRGIVQQAFTGNETQLRTEGFTRWFNTCKELEELRGFIEDHAARSQPDSHETRIRVEMNAIDAHATALYDHVARLHDQLPTFIDACIEYVNAWGWRKRWDFLMQNLRYLIQKLQQVSESMHVKLTDLGESLNHDEMTGGTASLVDPRRRFMQEQVLIELNLLRSNSATEYREAAIVVQRLIALAEPGDAQAMGHSQSGPGLDVIREQENEDLIFAPPRVTEARNNMKKLLNDMKVDLSDTGVFGQPSLESLVKKAQADTGMEEVEEVRSETGAQEEGSEISVAKGNGANVSEEAVAPTLVAIAAFEPPPSHQSQMLKLRVGDQVKVLGQDGRGWWYGKNSSGVEGWFPPSYVQLKPAHFSSASAMAGDLEEETTALAAQPPAASTQPRSQGRGAGVRLNR